MKTNRTFTIDVELIPMLKKINASELLDRLLKKHFNMTHGKKTENTKSR